MKGLLRNMTLLFLTLAGLFAALPASAQPDVNNEPKPRSPKIKPLQGYYWMLDEETGDSTICIVISNITVYPPMKFKNKKQEEFYWRTVRDVKKTLPYAKLICETLVETYEYIETFPTQKEREEHLDQMEKQVYKQYKPVLMKFSKGQAKVLVKLIQRETNQSSYNLIKTFFGGFKAGFYQTFGRLFGVNLKGKYQPDRNENDAIIERVCTLVEQGQL